MANVPQIRTFGALSVPAAGFPKYQVLKSDGTVFAAWTNQNVARQNNAAGTPTTTYAIALSLDPSAWYTILWDAGDGQLTTETFSGSATQTGDAFASLAAGVNAVQFAGRNITANSPVTVPSVIGTGTYSGTPPTVDQIAAAILANSANRLATAPDGSVALPATAPSGYGPGGAAVDTGTVASSPTPTTTTFSASGSLSAAYTPNVQQIRWTSGANAGIRVFILSFVGGTFALASALPHAPSAGDEFEVI